MFAARLGFDTITGRKEDDPDREAQPEDRRLLPLRRSTEGCNNSPKRTRGMCPLLCEREAMNTEFVTITHTNEGIRVVWPGGQADVFSNPIYLAESYAVAMRQREAARKALVGAVAYQINKVDTIIKEDASAESLLEAVDKVRHEAMEVAKWLS